MGTKKRLAGLLAATMLAGAVVCMPASAEPSDVNVQVSDLGQPTLGSAAAVAATDLTVAMSDESFAAPNGLTLPYRLYVPDSYDPNKSYPLLTYLHGAGERGTDNTAHVQVGVKLIERILEDETLSQNCIIIAPQCPPNVLWVDTPYEDCSYDLTQVAKSTRTAAVEALIAKMMSDYNIDPSRLYLSGISMGGYGTWDLLMRNPGMFAAAIPVCGAGDPNQAELIKHIPIRTYHGSADTVVPPTGTREMVAALEAVGGNIEYTELEGRSHSIWNIVYAIEDTLTWLFSHKQDGAHAVYDGNKLTLTQFSESGNDRTATVYLAKESAEGELMDIRVCSDVELKYGVPTDVQVGGMEVGATETLKVYVWSGGNAIRPMTGLLNAKAGQAAFQIYDAQLYPEL